MDFATKSALHYDAIAPRYDEHLATDTWIRGAFHDLVLQYVPAGSLMLDFGCGTGTDALWYAKNGRRVIACDVSAGMMAELEKKCRAQIVGGKIMPHLGDYADLLNLSLPEKPLAVLCNFGVLSLIPDLPGVFDAFAGYVAPGGYVIANNLNPLFWRELASPWFWKHMIHSRGRGGVRTFSPKCDTCRYLAGALDKAARSHGFRRIARAGVDCVLSREACRHEWSAPASSSSWPHRLEKKFWKAPLFRAIGRYSFLVYGKCG